MIARRHWLATYRLRVARCTYFVGNSNISCHVNCTVNIFIGNAVSGFIRVNFFFLPTFRVKIFLIKYRVTYTIVLLLSGVCEYKNRNAHVDSGNVFRFQIHQQSVIGFQNHFRTVFVRVVDNRLARRVVTRRRHAFQMQIAFARALTVETVRFANVTRHWIVTDDDDDNNNNNNPDGNRRFHRVKRISVPR